MAGNHKRSKSHNGLSDSQQKEIEKEEGLVDALPPEFGKEDFNPSKYELENLPERVDIEYLDNVLEEKEKVLDAVNNRLSSLIMSSYASFVQGMSQIHELGVDLKQSAMMCRTSKTHLVGVQEGMTVGSLKILAKYNKRQVLNNLVSSMGKIKGLLADEQVLKRLIAEGDYPAAIQKCLECQSTLGTLLQFSALQGLGMNFGEHYRLIQDRLDASLQQMCSTFPFSPAAFQRVVSAYKLLGKADRMVERLTPFFVDTVEAHAAKIVKTHVLLIEQNAMKPETFKSMPLRDLAQHLDEENYIDCLRSVLEYLCDLIAAHTSMSSYLKGKHEGQSEDQDGEPTSPHKDSPMQESKFVADLLSCLARVTKSSWENMQRLLTLIVFGFKPTFKVEEFLRTLYCLHKFLSIGEEFARIKGETLRQALLKQSKIYFEYFHAARLEDLRTMLEHEMWHKCPLQPEFTVFDVKEFRQAVTTRESYNTFTNTTYTLPQGNLEKLLKEGNPFAKPTGPDGEPRSPTLNGTNGASGSEPWWSLGGTNAEAEKEIELRAEMVRKRFQKENGAEATMTLTPATINVVRFMGKYLSMMTLLPLPTVVWNGLTQLFDYYLNAVVLFFTPSGASLEESASYELRSLLQRLQKSYSSGSAPASPNISHRDKEDDKKMRVPVKGAAVSEGLSDPKQMYGLSYRVVAIESLLFLVDALRSSLPLIQTTLPTNKLDIVNKFYSDTLAVVSELRIQWYKCIAKTLINFENVTNSIANIKWDTKDIGLEHNGYVDLLLRDFKEIAKGTEALEIPPIPKHTLWDSLLSNAMEALVDGYSKAKKCSNEGRALMSLDLKVLLHSLENVVPAPPSSSTSSTFSSSSSSSSASTPRISPSHFTYVDNYIKAFYLPQNELVVWARDHPDYTSKQVAAILTSNINSNLKKKQRQDLLNALEDVDKMRKKESEKH